MKRLLIIHHSMTDGTRQMAQAALEGAMDESNIAVAGMHAAREAAADDLPNDALVIGLGELTDNARPFAAERRFEQRHPHTAALLPAVAQGYEHTPAAAQAILEFLEANFPVNPHMAQRIKALTANS